MEFQLDMRKLEIEEREYGVRIRKEENKESIFREKQKTRDSWSYRKIERKSLSAINV